MTVKIADIQNNDKSEEKQESGSRELLTSFVVVFLLSLFALIVGMSLHPNAYDEGIVLTGSMRVAAGQVPHRDFYSIYGPAQFYILAVLFKFFGQTLLIERALDLFYRALLVASVYVIAVSYVRRRIAVCASAVTLVWLFALYYYTVGAATIPVSLLNLVSTGLVVQAFTHPVSRRRIFAVGVLSGLASLFRYDTGIALLWIHVCVIAIGVTVRLKEDRFSGFIAQCWPYLLGFGVVVLSPIVYYFSVAPVQPFIHDVIFFPSHYYHRARNLPFPTITLKSLDNFAIYLPIAILGVSLFAIVTNYLREKDNGASAYTKLQNQRGQGFLIAFSLLAMAMYLKGVVRVGVIQMYLATIPTILLTALLFEERSVFWRPVRRFIVMATCLTVLSPAWGSLREIRDMYVQHVSLPEHVWSTVRKTSPAIRATWCATTSPLTRGLCFLPEDYRIQAIEFIQSHTRPDQTLFVGVTRHDKIVANDNLTYFATHRLPATRWSHFDPDLQTSAEIQKQIVSELEINLPPYIILDSEYDLQQEPNDSSRSSGVTILDDYLHRKYHPLHSFGQMSIWQRTPAL